MKKKELSLASKMGLALLFGVIAGLFFVFCRETLNSSGHAETWAAINNVLFQDITAVGAESAIGIFYIAGQLFVRALQLVIVPMVFTSIALAVGRITDARQLGRISAKTLGWFLFTTVLGLTLASIVGYTVYSAGWFTLSTDGFAASTGSTGSNALTVLLNAIPTNIGTAFSSNTAVLAIVFLAVAMGLSMNNLGEEKTSTLKKIFVELNDILVVFLNFVVTKFGPVAIFFLISRTFATYGIESLKPAAAYMLTTTILLLVFLFVVYPLLVWASTKCSPVIFVKKIMKVLLFGFSTSSSAAALPLNLETTTKEMGVSDHIASFVLPLGMTVNMDGTAIMQVVATLFVAGCGGYKVSVASLIIISLLALVASIGTPAAPGAGAIILFTILSGAGFTGDAALMAYSLILAINRPIEMLVTALNVVGDSRTCMYVARSENALDDEVFNS